MTPQKLGPYLIEEILGRGGMGTVYRGIDPESSEQVAIKILAPELADDPAFLDRFQEEVQTLLQLKHPNIVQLLSFGKQDDIFYFAMELVEGKSLYALQKAGHAFSYLEIVEIGLQVCEGLQHSHNLGVVHRDLKPGNIIRATDGRIKLADYGIAKRFGGQQMTMSGVLGTAEFMAPEQAMGKPATIQSDLYSLGAVLFALAAGKPPIEGSSPHQTLEKVVKTRAPFLTAVVKDAPEELALLVERLLKKQPENRLRSARSVAARLQEILELLRDRAEMETHLVVSSEPGSAAPQINSAGATLVDLPAGGQSAGRGGDPAGNAAAGKGKDLATKSGTEKSEVGGRKRAAESVSARVGAATLRDPGVGTMAPANRVLREQDFFERAVYGQAEEEPHEVSSHWVTFLLACGLLVLVSISGYLVYDRVLRDRTADELWEVIDAGQERPMGVTREMDKFLELYPDDSRAADVEALKAKSKAFQFRNALALRASLNRRDLSDLERQFLKLTADDTDSKWDKEVALQALITYYQTGPDPPPPAVADCLEAAEVYRQIYRRQALPEVEEKLQEILARIEAAERLESENPVQAAQIRQSLIELFGDKKWAEPLIEPLRRGNGR